MLATRSRERNKISMKLYSRQKQRVGTRRLERRNAIRNIDYDASTSPSSSFDDQFDNQSAQRSRSLDILSVSERTSFRIEGTEGEFEVICRRLGLSGPDDFAISTADWEKRRAYSPTGGNFSSTSRLNHSNQVLDRESPESNLSARLESKVSFSDDEFKIDGECSRSGEIGDARVLVKRDDDVSPSGVDESRFGDGDECLEISNGVGLAIDGSDRVLEDEMDKTHERRRVESGSGIKGLRPPLLAPPPSMSRVIVDHTGSNWDLIRSFAPMDNEDLASDGPDDANVETSEMMTSRIDTIVSPSGSEMVVDEDEELSSVAVEISSTTGSFRGGFKNWQKGDFLGSGSFGTVYEGFNE